MPDRAQLIQILHSGNVEALTQVQSSKVSRDDLESEEVQVAVMFAAERVVFHRPHYREVINHFIELGTPCDLWTAARAGLRLKTEALLEVEPELLNEPNTEGRTALQRAALIYGICRECEEVADFLMNQGAKVDIFTASTLGMADIVQQELDHTRGLVAERCQGSTPLNWAVRPRRNFAQAPAICQALIDAGADVHDQDMDEAGMTPLHHAAEWGHPICIELVDVLLRAGADLQKADDQGWKPMDYAQDRQREEMIDHLFKKSKK